MSDSLLLKENHFFVQINPEINAICQPFFKQHDMVYFAYIRHYNDGSCAPLVSNAALMQHHLKHQYQCYPNLPSRLTSQKKFHYIVMPDLEDGFNQAAFDYKTYFNISHPFYLFEQYQDYFDLYVFSMANGNASSVNHYFSYLPDLENFKFYFKDKAHKIIENSLKNKLYLPKSMLPNWVKKTEPLPSLPKTDLLPQKYYFEHDHEYLCLNPRQMEVIKYLGQGHTAKETGQLLNISTRTIEFYIDEIKSKFHLKKKSELIAYCYKWNIL